MFNYLVREGDGGELEPPSGEDLRDVESEEEGQRDEASLRVARQAKLFEAAGKWMWRLE